MRKHEQAPIVHNADGIRIYGPHPNGRFNMAVDDSWISSFFVSKEAAISWVEDLNEAERLWAQHGKLLEMRHD